MRRRVASVVGALAALLCAGCGPRPETNSVVFTPEEVGKILRLSPLPKLPPSPTNAFADNTAAALFGQRLFFEPRLSSNGKVSCATCHDPTQGFADRKALSLGVGTTVRHSMPLWNVGYQRWFFWDGRADSLWAQALHPMLHDAEMGASVQHLLAAVKSDPALNAGYESLFGALPGTIIANTASGDRFLSNLGKALEAYQRRIVSSAAPFDRFVEDLRNAKKPLPAEAISESAQRGLKLFLGKGRCVLCHSGPTFSDGEFHNIGLPGPPADQGRFTGIADVQADRFNGLGSFSDDHSPETNIKLRYLTVKMNHLGEFKTPTLRHVAETAPYMHDGRFATLRDVLDFYSELPGEPIFGHREETLVPAKFTDTEKADLEAFLHTLTGAPLDTSLSRAPR